MVPVCCALFVALAASANAAVSRISPELKPESSDKFFKKDYPADMRPSAKTKALDFSHPYPALQDSSAFSDDFVKDENGDNGEWKAQSEYDRLRNKLRKEELEAQKAYEKKEEEMKELEEAMKKAKEAGKKSDVARAELKKGEGLKKWGDDEDGIKAATEKVKKEMDDLEKCKKELEDAKAKLKKLIDAKQEKTLKDIDAMPAAEKTLKERKEKEAELKNQEDVWAAKVAEERLEHEEAEKKYEQEKKDLQKTKDDLAKAEERLRQLRGGAHTWKGFDKSFATRSRLALTTCILVAGISGLSVMLSS